MPLLLSEYDGTMAVNEWDDVGFFSLVLWLMGVFANSSRVRIPGESP